MSSGSLRRRLADLDDRLGTFEGDDDEGGDRPAEEEPAAGPEQHPEADAETVAAQPSRPGILDHIAKPSTPPRIAPACGPPPWEDDDSGVVFLDEDSFTSEPLVQPEPSAEFDQHVSW